MIARVFVADDETLARAKLARLIKREPDVELVGESGDGRSAVASISTLRPDVVFLDIQMPELDGFETLAALPPDVRPLIVFVTAYDEYAVRAFGVHATDYLLKPFGAGRFQETMQRVRIWLANRAGERSFLDRVSVRSRGRVELVSLSDVEWVEAVGNYVRLHHARGKPMLRQSLSGLLALIDPARFVRIHRGALVNVACIAEMSARFSGDYVITLRSGTRLRLSRSYRAALDRLLASGRTARG